MNVSQIRIIVVAVVAALGILAAFIFPTGRPPEGPVYAGRTLSGWLADIDGQLSHPDRTLPEFLLASNAVVQIGTNGLPFLLEWIQFEESPPQWRFRYAAGRLLDRLPSIVVPWRLQVWADWGPMEYRRSCAAGYALVVLGPSLKSAIPQLSVIAADSIHRRASEMAVLALCAAGPAAWPEVLRLATNTSSMINYGATRGLVPMGTNALPAIPALLTHLAGTNERDSRFSASALGQLRLDPDRVVPALASALRSPHSNVRRASAMALAEFGGQANPALPALRQALKSDDLYLVKAVSNSIQTITAASAAEAPPR